MSDRYPGGIITKTPVTPTGPYQDGTAPGIWTLEQQAYWKAQGLWPIAGNTDPGDPYYKYVTMLLTGNGTNGAQNNTFLDSSTNAFSITRNGNTTQGSFSPYGSLWSNYFSGSSYLLINHSSSFNLGTSDFCMECFINISSTPNLILGKESEYWLNYSRTDLGTTSNKIGFSIYSSSGWFAVSSTTTPVVGVWYHIAAVRSGTNLSLYVNGVREGNITIPAGTFDAYSEPFNIGAWDYDPSSERMNGYISNVRFVKGSSVYSGSTITVPTTPLTAITNTVLLTCQSNRFIDNSSNAFAITVSGSPSVQRFSPFEPDSPGYTTAVFGGSGYFDGSGDSLKTPTSITLGTSDFTIEFWINDLVSGRQDWFEMFDGSNYTWRIQILTLGSSIGYYVNNSFVTGGSYTFALNSWHHIAVTRTSGTCRIFVDGIQLGSNATNTTDFQANWAQVGNGAGGTYVTGYMSDVRIISGTSLYTGNFTPPTTPLTSTGSQTKLLLNMTNAGIPDSAMMNDLETVGNAQVSTSVKKFGTGSIAFDGTGDWLATNVATNNLYAFGTGNFTIEMWLYVNSVDTFGHIYDSRPTSTDGSYPCLRINGSNQLEYVVGGSVQITAGSGLSTSTWYHVAITRSGTSTKLFVNGTQSGSTYTDSTDYINATQRPLIGGWGYNSGGGYSLNGYIDDLRITKGYARYTSNFTAPTAAFPTY